MNDHRPECCLSQTRQGEALHIMVEVPSWRCGPPVSAEEVERAYKWLQSQEGVANGLTQVPALAVLRSVAAALRAKENTAR